MRILSGKEFAKLLEKHGWVLKTVKGSHHIYMKHGHSARLSIPIHGNKSLKIGLMRHIMKIACITENDL